jgi:hypothetical protein
MLLLKRRDFLTGTAAANDGMAKPDKLLSQGAPQSARNAGDQNGFHICLEKPASAILQKVPGINRVD